MSSWLADKIEPWPITRLIPYARNARTHSDAQVAKIAASIREFGWTNPVLVDGDNGIIAGHGRLLAARKLGMAEVPVIELAGLSEAQKRAYVLADNKLALNALGASIDASGELSVPEGGNPEQPVGQVQARFNGVNGLIDRLVQLGVIAPDEVAGYRMMLTMFARPAPEGGDALVSQFEFREGGQIFANGQQVQ